MTKASTALLPIILVHGLWGYSGHWSGVITALTNSKHYNTTNLQAVDIPLTSVEDDANRVKQAISQVNGSVLLVGHSYGGEVITRVGNDPKVAGLVYIAALGIDQNESVASILQQYPAAAAANIEPPDSDGYIYIKPDLFQESFCQDLSFKEANVLAISQKAPNASVFLANLTDTPAWKSKPSWYQVSTEDHMINPDAERFMAQRMQAQTIEINSSHASLASHPKEIAQFILDAARNLTNANSTGTVGPAGGSTASTSGGEGGQTNGTTGAAGGSGSSETSGASGAPSGSEASAGPSGTASGEATGASGGPSGTESTEAGASATPAPSGEGTSADGNGSESGSQPSTSASDASVNASETAVSDSSAAASPPSSTDASPSPTSSQ